MGRGTGVAEVRGDPNDPSKDTELELDVKLYNGSLDTDRNGDPMDPRPGLLLYTELDPDTPIVFPFWGEKRGRQVALRGPAEPGSECQPLRNHGDPRDDRPPVRPA